MEDSMEAGKKLSCPAEKSRGNSILAAIKAIAQSTMNDSRRKKVKRRERRRGRNEHG
ncbi:hypothetical protein X777_06385 [Ooceraea biroi]|uniref:Uncharacterized protein n=1 Tax=Ooceraea biroi TaxID=2015173 RepID=A0A026WCA6_OOCBI|nr:hypothetical protein X777_06385 [Ooceraea biroi]